MVLSLRPNADYGRLANFFPRQEPEDGNVAMLDTDRVRDQFFAALVRLEVDDDEFRDLFREARIAFGKLSRRGFRARDLDDPDMIDGFAAAAAPLFEINDHLARFCLRLGRVALPRGDWSTQFDADRAVFKSQFDLLYGEPQ